MLRFTEDQYLQMERTAEYKSEFDNGEIRPMAGAGFGQINIASDLFGELYQRLRGSKCRAYTADCRIKITEKAIYRYPDIAIISGPAAFSDNRREAITNPVVLIEIFPSTEYAIRWRKFQQYQRLDSLKECILVSSEAMLVESYVRQGCQWLLTSYKGKDAVLFIEAANVEIPLSAIYANVEVSEEID